VLVGGWLVGVVVCPGLVGGLAVRCDAGVQQCPEQGQGRVRGQRWRLLGQFHAYLRCLRGPAVGVACGAVRPCCGPVIVLRPTRFGRA
jgi:hypothetical protein